MLAQIIYWGILVIILIISVVKATQEVSKQRYTDEEVEKLFRYKHYHFTCFLILLVSIAIVFLAFAGSAFISYIF